MSDRPLTGYTPSYIAPTAPQVQGPGAPVRIDAEAAGLGFSKMATAIEKGVGFIDALDEAASLNEVAERIKVLGETASSYHNEFATSLSGLRPQEDMQKWGDTFEQVRYQAMKGASSRVEKAMKKHIANVQLQFHERAQAAVTAATRQRTRATLDSSLESWSHAGMNAIDPAERDAAWGKHEELILAQAGAGLLMQSEVPARTQADREKFYFLVAKYQAETRPGSFVRDWKSGKWAEKLSAESLVRLQPLVETSEITDRVRELQVKFPTNPAAAVREALSPQYGEAHGLTVEQQNKIAAYHEGLSNFNWQQTQRARAQAEESGIVNLSGLVAKNDLDGIQKLANSPGVAPSIRLKAAEIVSRGARDWRGNDTVFKDALSKALTGDISNEDILAQAGPDGMSMEQATKVLALRNKTPQEDKENFALALKAFAANNGDKEQHARFMAALRYQAEKEGAHGEAILYLGEKLGRDTNWILPSNAPYLEIYREMESTGAVRARSAGATYTREEQNEATKILRDAGKPITPANINAVVVGVIRKRRTN